MEPTSDSLRTTKPLAKPDVSWFQRLSRPILFLIVSLTLVGGYLAFTIPVSVFPNTDFPRIVIGVDNGVMPIDQMLVVITRPIEEAVNSVPGLLKVQNHVGIPIEEKIDFGGAAAGDGLNLQQTRDAVDGFFDQAGDHHEHLVDGHDAVVHA